MPIYTVIGTATYFTNSGPTPPPAINYYLYTTGLNTYGQLGLGDTINRSSPSLLSSGVSWLMFSNYGYSSSGIQSDGSLWTWGRNNAGQLGSGTTVDRSSPVKVGTDSWYRVRVGYEMAFGVKSDRTLWAWGENSDGYLGLNSRTTLYYSSPVQVGGDLWEDVVPAGRITRQYVFAQRSGSALIYTWGNNFYGQLGLNDVIARSSPVQLPVFSLNQMPFVAVNGYSVLGQKTDSTLWGWGYNNTGQLGLGDTLNRSSPVQVGLDLWSHGATTFTNGFGVKNDGTLWGWGQNNVGQIGTPNFSPAALSWTSMARTMGIRSTPAGVGVSSSTSVHALRSDGTMWAWGENRRGELGVGDTTRRASPTQIGTDTDWAILYRGMPEGNAAAIKTDGRLYKWGYNINGTLGTGDTQNRSTPTQLPGSWIQVSGALQLDTNGALWITGGWGFGNGDGTTVRRSNLFQVGAVTGYKLVESSADRTFHVVRSNDKLFAWGFNQYGTIGDNTTTNRSSMVAVLAVSSFSQVSSGGYHMLGITSIGRLFAWGLNTWGQVGSNTATSINRSSPTAIGTSTWSLISGGEGFTLGQTNDGRVFAWGTSIYGQWGDLAWPGGNTANWYRSSPVLVQSGLGSWTILMAGASTGLHPSPASTQPAHGIKGGQLYSWGHNGSYNFGTSPSVTVPQMSSPVQIPTASSAVATYSYTSSPIQIGTDTQWGRVYGGSDYTIATDINGTLYAWGENTYGQLGTGDTVRRSSPVQIATGLAQTGLYVGYDARPGWSATTYGKPTA
jgi:alpha-tubulin suppressor-like RCC1 family protein